jgi:hypothetical protein
MFSSVIEFPLQQHFEFLCIINLLNVAKQGDDNKAHIEWFCWLLSRYCEADDRWVEAVRFLDLDDGAGWQLLQVGLHVICEAQSSLWSQ